MLGPDKKFHGRCATTSECFHHRPIPATCRPARKRGARTLRLARTRQIRKQASDRLEKTPAAFRSQEWKPRAAADRALGGPDRSSRTAGPERRTHSPQSVPGKRCDFHRRRMSLLEYPSHSIAGVEAVRRHRREPTKGHEDEWSDTRCAFHPVSTPVRYFPAA